MSFSLTAIDDFQDVVMETRDSERGHDHVGHPSVLGLLQIVDLAHQLRRMA